MCELFDQYWRKGYIQGYIQGTFKDISLQENVIMLHMKIFCRIYARN